MDAKLQRDLEQGNVLSVQNYIIYGKPKTKFLFFKDGYQAAGLFDNKTDKNIFKILCTHPGLVKLLPIFVENIHAICKREGQFTDTQLVLLNESLNKDALDLLDHDSVLKLLKQFYVEGKSVEPLFNKMFKYVFTNSSDDAASMVQENPFHLLVKDPDLVKLIYTFIKKVDTLSNVYNISSVVLLSLLRDKLTHEVNGKAPIDHMSQKMLQSLAKLLKSKYTETKDSDCKSEEYKKFLKIILESSYTVILDDSLLTAVVKVHQGTKDMHLGAFFDIMVTHYIQTAFKELPMQWASDDLLVVQHSNSIYETLGEHKSPRREKLVVTPEVVFEKMIAKVSKKEKEHNKLQKIFGEKYSLAHVLLYLKPNDKMFIDLKHKLQKEWKFEGNPFQKCLETLTTDHLLKKFTFADESERTLLKHACQKNSDLLVLLYTRMVELNLLNCNTALEVAISCHNKQLVQYIINHDASAIDWYSFLRNSIKYANNEAVQLYIDSESLIVKESHDRQGVDSNEQYTIFNYALLSLTELCKSRLDVKKNLENKIEIKMLSITNIVDNLHKSNKLYLATDQVNKLSENKSVLAKTNSLFKNLCKFARLDGVLKKVCSEVGEMLLGAIDNKDLQKVISESLQKIHSDDTLSAYNESSIGTHRSVLSDMHSEYTGEDSLDIVGDLTLTS